MLFKAPGCPSSVPPRGRRLHRGRRLGIGATKRAAAQWEDVVAERFAPDPNPAPHRVPDHAAALCDLAADVTVPPVSAAPRRRPRASLSPSAARREKVGRAHYFAEHFEAADTAAAGDGPPDLPAAVAQLASQWRRLKTDERACYVPRALVKDTPEWAAERARAAFQAHPHGATDTYAAARPGMNPALWPVRCKADTYRFARRPVHSYVEHHLARAQSEAAALLGAAPRRDAADTPAPAEDEEASPPRARGCTSSADAAAEADLRARGVPADVAAALAVAQRLAREEGAAAEPDTLEADAVGEPCTVEAAPSDAAETEADATSDLIAQSLRHATSSLLATWAEGKLPPRSKTRYAVAALRDTRQAAHAFEECRAQLFPLPSNRAVVSPVVRRLAAQAAKGE